MVVDHALGIARRAGCVVERDGVPFVRGRPPLEAREAALDEILVLDGAQPLADLRELGVVVFDEARLHAALLDGFLDGRRELAVVDQDLRLGVIELEGDDRRIEAGIDRVQHGSGHGHAEVRLQHRRGVREHDRDGVALADAEPGKCRGEPAGALVELRVGKALVPVDDGHVVRMHRRGSLEEGERRKGLIVGGRLAEMGVVGVLGHEVDRNAERSQRAAG